MAEATPSRTPDRSTDLAYRPLSGLAIAAFTLAALYTAVVALSTAAALLRGSPIFLPDWLISMPLAALVLAVLAQAQIRNSEGTRAGALLARWALWLSLFVGLGYFAYTTFTALALGQQAEAFLLEEQDADTGFFAHLERGGKDVNIAFLLTLPPSARGGSDPASDERMARQFDKPDEEGGKGKLSRFRDHQLVRAVTTAGNKGVHIEPLGMVGWTYERRSYQVMRNYRITTPELILDALLPIHSWEGSVEGERRKWSLALPKAVLKSEQLTPLGEKLQALRRSSRAFLEKMLRGLNKGEALKDFAKFDQTHWDKVIAAEPLRKHVRSELTSLFEQSQPNRLGLVLLLKDSVLPWTQLADGKLRLAQEFDWRLPAVSSFPAVRLQGWFWLESQEPVNLEAPPASPEWTVQGIEVISAGQIAPPKQE